MIICEQWCPAIPAPVPRLPLNQSTHPADGPVYRQSQIVRIGKHTFLSVVDLKFGLAIRTDFFAWIGISARIRQNGHFKSAALRGGVFSYAAQAVPPINAENAGRDHLWTENSYNKAIPFAQISHKRLFKL